MRKLLLGIEIANRSIDIIEALEKYEKMEDKELGAKAIRRMIENSNDWIKDQMKLIK